MLGGIGVCFLMNFLSARSYEPTMIGTCDDHDFFSINRKSNAFDLPMFEFFCKGARSDIPYVQSTLIFMTGYNPSSIRRRRNHAILRGRDSRTDLVSSANIKEADSTFRERYHHDVPKTCTIAYFLAIDRKIDWWVVDYLLILRPR